MTKQLSEVDGDTIWNDPVDAVAEWMESLGFTWGKTLEVWSIDDKILKPWVTPEQAAFFYQQMLEARTDELEALKVIEANGKSATIYSSIPGEPTITIGERLAFLQAQKGL